jgi:tape measure domain-containing protein
VTTTLETLGIDIEIDPRAAKSGLGAVDRAIESVEEQAKRTSAVMSTSLGAAARQAAAAQGQASRSAARQAAESARQAALAQGRSAREAAQAARDAARDEVAAWRAAHKAVADSARATARAQADAARQAAREAESASRAQAGRGSGGGIGGKVGMAAMGVVGGALGAREVMDMADAWTEAGNRLRQLHKDEATLLLVQRELFASAQEVGVVYSDHAALYQRVGKAAMGMGRSAGQAVAITETISKAIKASGADAVGASAALMQLGQALDSGKLRGEEFNSVAEQAPIILDLLGRHLGKSRAELRKMAEEGKLTSNVIITAMEGAGPAIDDAFGKRLPTFSDQLVRLRNEASKTFGELAEHTGAVNLLGAALGAVGDSLKAIAEAAGLASDAVGAFADLAGKIPGVKQVMGGLSGFGGDKGFKLGRHALPIIGTGLMFKDAFTGDFDPFDLNTTDDEAERAQQFAAKRGSRWIIGPQQRAAAAQQRAAEQAAVADLKRLASSGVGRAFAGLIPSIPIDENGFIKSNKGDVDGARAAKQHADERKRLREEFDRFGASLSLVEAAEIELSRAEDLLHRAQAAGLTTGEEAAEQLARKKELLKDQLDPLGAVMRGIQEERDLLLMSNREREIEAERRRIVVDLQRQGVAVTEAESAQLRAALEVQQRIREEQEKQAALREIEKTHGADVIQDRFRATMKQAEAMRAELALVEEQKKKLIDEQWKEGMTDALGGAFDTALRSVIDWKEGTVAALKEAAREFAIQVAFMTAKALALKAIGAAFGTSGVPGGAGIGGFLADIVSGGNHAHGGTYTVPGSGGGVDSRNVMFRVTPGERITFTPPGMAGPSGGSGGSGGSGAPPVILNARVINVGDPAEAALAALNSQPGEQLIWNVLAKSPGKLKQLVSG